MRPFVAALALGLCGAVAPAAADQPLLRPTRDVEVTYRGAGPQGLQQRVRWLAATQTMRIDPPTSGLYVIIDYVARRMSVVRDPEKTVIEMAAPAGVADTLGGKTTGDFVREGKATVAGLACTEWQMLDRNARQTTMCITGDGVLLRVGTAERTLVSAVSVQYAPQDPAVFRVPADYTRKVVGAAR